MVLLVYTDLVLAYILVLYIVLFYQHHVIVWYMFYRILCYDILHILVSYCTLSAITKIKMFNQSSIFFMYQHYTEHSLVIIRHTNHSTRCIVCTWNSKRCYGRFRTWWRSISTYSNQQCLYSYCFSFIEITTITFHDDVIKWKHFPRYWPLCGEFTGPRWIPGTKASDAELWCFLWSASEWTVE